MTSLGQRARRSLWDPARYSLSPVCVGAGCSAQQMGAQSNLAQHCCLLLPMRISPVLSCLRQ